MLAAHGERAVEYGLCLPECETGLPLSSMGGWKLGLRAGWNGAAARRSRSAITRGGVGGLWMRDSRIPASVVAKFRIAWRASCYFLLEIKIGNTTGTRAWKGSRVRQTVRIWERFGASLHHPFYPCHSVSPPRPLHPRYQISIDRCAALARACARPHHHPVRLSTTLHPPQHTFYLPLPTNHRPALSHAIAPLHDRMQPDHIAHASLRVHPSQ